MQIYIVKPGDTIISIANGFNISPDRIIVDNELTNPNNLVVGQSLVILFPDIIHTVQPGDTLFSIANQYNIDVLQILRNNAFIGNTGTIAPGQELVITYMPTDEPNNGIIADVELNGYAYTFIDRTVLRKTLPYLTYLAIFTYGFTPEGELILPTPSDEELIRMALEFRVAPIMVLAPMSESGAFSNELAKAMLNNPTAVNNLIENIVTNIKNKNYSGVDIDFEFILPEDKDAFIDFIAKISERLRQEGYLTMAALAPKTSANQPGLLYESHDYPAIGALVDRALIMTYEWGYARHRISKW